MKIGKKTYYCESIESCIVIIFNNLLKHNINVGQVQPATAKADPLCNIQLKKQFHDFKKKKN